MKRISSTNYPDVKRRLPQEDRAVCILSGTTHQGDPKFQGNNAQCVAMSACASILSVFKNRELICSDIDIILQSGDDLYISRKHLLPSGEPFLMPEDLPTKIRVGHYLAQIERLDDSWIQNGLFPNNPFENECKLILENILKNDVFTGFHNDSTDSIMFTGQHYTVSFWRYNNAYYLFNSHGVDDNNKSDNVNGVARLFKCESLGELVKLLFARNIYDNSQYALHRIRVINNNSEGHLVSELTSQSILDGLQLTSGLLSPVTSDHTTQSPSILNGLQLTPKLTSSVISINSVIQSPSILDGFELPVLSAPVISLGGTSCNSLQSGLQSTPTLPSSVESMNALVIKKTKSTPLDPTTTKSKTVQINNILSASNTQKNVVEANQINKPVVVLQNMFSELTTENVEIPMISKKKGRPQKQKRGVKRTKVNAHLDAVKKYNEKNPQIHHAAVDRYNEQNPQIHRAAVDRYNEQNPQIHRAAVDRYNEQNPQIHRAAVDRYNEQNPQIHRAAVDRYNEQNPQINRAAVARYSKHNPEINRKASDKYNKNSRNIDVPLRQSSSLLAQKKDNELNTIKLYSLKKTSLYASNIFKCPQCGAPFFEEEKSRKQWCCGSGKFNIQNFTPLTEEFYSHPSFVNRPRAYNNLFALSALGVSHGYQHPAGISFIKIQGRIYHRVFDLAYSDSVNNLGLYINDPSEREQLAAENNLDTQVVRCINNFLHTVNPYIDCFKRLNQEPSDEAFIKFQQTSRSTHGNILGDLPVGREVAAIISTEREEYVPRCIAVWKVGNKKPHTVDIMHPLYESFQYPLLYPEGNPGWYPNKLDNNGNKLSQVKYVRCLLLSQSRFSETGRLSEEWLVDMYCRISEERLRFISSLQKHNSNDALRSAPFAEVEMSIENANLFREDETIQGEGIVPGRVYLPSTFTGGPRYMKQKYCDAIAVVSRLGNPSFFLTFTCNPKWQEIQQSTRSNRINPTVCARVFNLKLTELLRDIRSGRYFGKLVYMMHVIEFQKRGLPHAHICFRVEGGGPAHNLDIDKFVRADIPDASEAEGKLKTAVLNHMIHGPCGPPHRTNLPCWDNEKKKCSKFFPKRETNTTFIDDKGFINLCRNSKNEAIIKYRGQEVTVNDTWVVPYNATLILKYDAHINLEVSTHRKVVKYLFKYITKGPDESRVAIVPEEHKNNEIEQYVTKRYIGSSDAAWRTLEFDVTAREPNVKQLSVHLENQQSVYFKPGTEVEAAQRSSSDLLTYFNRPTGEEFDQLSYLAFYEKYIVHSKRPSTKNTEIYETSNNKFLTKRQRGELVARLFWVAPNRGEQFYLRILLQAYPCRSYTDLINLGGPNCKTFQEAAKIVGLADDEVEYERAMLEASAFFTGPRLRSFFVLLAVNGVPVASLWDTFKKQLSEDISHRLGTEDDDRVHTLCLIQINRMLRKHGSSLAQHGLPEVVDNTTELGREREEYNCDTLIEYVTTWDPCLSPDQRIIYDYVSKLCTDSNFRATNNTAIFVDGPAGTGKTLLLKVVTAYVRGNLKEVVLCTASSAIAAQNYEGGTTAHSMFKFPLDIVDDLGYWNITNGTQRAELIYHSTVIIYDEAPMAHKYLIHLLDRSLRDLMRNDKIFGGKIIIFAGDFRQIPPVVTDAKTNSDILNASVKTSPIWRKLKSFALTTSQRCSDDVEFAEFLLNLGSNKLPTHALKTGNTIQNFIDLSGIDVVSDVDELIDFVFPFLSESCACIHRAILCTRNDAVKEINDIILERLEGETLHFYSIDKVESDTADELFYGADSLNRMQPRGIPEHDLKLKIGCVCMIMRNLSFADGLVNGTKVIVTATSPRIITVEKSGSTDKYLIPRILFKGPIDPNSPFEMCRRQFPLQLSYAMTIHKSQGQTISRVGIDLRSDMFSHGQLYVALGRVTNKNCIKILIHQDRLFNDKPYAKNVIIPELL